jgi:hypothetical protein
MDFKSQYREFYGCLYQLHEKYHDAETLKQWQALAKEAGALSKKYPSEFATAAITAVVDEIERRFKAGDQL